MHKSTDLKKVTHTPTRTCIFFLTSELIWTLFFDDWTNLIDPLQKHYTVDDSPVDRYSTQSTEVYQVRSRDLDRCWWIWTIQCRDRFTSGHPSFHFQHRGTGCNTSLTPPLKAGTTLTERFLLYKWHHGRSFRVPLSRSTSNTVGEKGTWPSPDLLTGHDYKDFFWPLRWERSLLRTEVDAVTSARGGEDPTLSPQLNP